MTIERIVPPRLNGDAQYRCPKCGAVYDSHWALAAHTAVCWIKKNYIEIAPHLTIEQLKAIQYEDIDCEELLYDIMDYLCLELDDRMEIERDIDEQRRYGWMG